MATSITYDIVKSAIAGGYRLAVTLTDSVGFADEKLLIINRVTAAFSRIASIYDLNTYPGVSNPAYEFYRASVFNIDLLIEDDADALALAIVAEANLIDSLQTLVDAWNTYAATFVGSSSGTLLNG